jgi:hypothetical protein
VQAFFLADAAADAWYDGLMTEAALWICAALALSFLINLVPALMPSTWMVLAFFYIKFDLPLLLLTIPGAIVSGLGRLLLAKGSTLFKRRLLTGQEADLQELGRFLEEHRNYVGLTVFLYALSPFPTNNLFIAAGMTEVGMTRVMVGFCCARILANTFWVWTTNRVFESLGGLFQATFGSWVALVLQIASLSSIVMLYKLPWARWLRRLASRVSTERPKAARR